MNKRNFKSYAFIMAILASVLVLLNSIGDTFGFVVDEVAITGIVTGILGVLVVLGIVVKDNDTPKNDKIDAKTDHKNEDE